MLRDLRGRAADLGYAAGWNLVQAAPRLLTTPAFRAAADLAVARNGGGVQQLRANYRRVLGPDSSEQQLDELVAAGMRSYARYWHEAFRLPRMDHAKVLEQLTPNTVGIEHLDAALERGNGAVVALPHQGNWDMAGLWLVATRGTFTTVVERLEPESLYRRFVDYREGLGFEILPLTGGERPAFEVLRERLRHNGVVCLLCDRDLSRSGIDVQLFGETARLPGGPAMLAATTGAPLLPVGCWFTPDGGWGQRIGAPIELSGTRLREQVRTATQALADALASEIAEHPADWHMLQKVWLADRSARAVEADGTGRSGPVVAAEPA